MDLCLPVSCTERSGSCCCRAAFPFPLDGKECICGATEPKQPCDMHEEVEQLSPIIGGDLEAAQWSRMTGMTAGASMADGRAIHEGVIAAHAFSNFKTTSSPAPAYHDSQHTARSSRPIARL